MEILKIPSSTYYDSLKEKPPSKKRKRGRKPPGYSLSLDGKKVSDHVIVELLKELRSDPFLQAEGGSKILALYVKKELNVVVNHKKIYRLCKENDLLLTRRKRKSSKFRKISKNRRVTGINQVWEFDIKYGWIHEEKKFFFILAFIDVFSRKIKGYYAGTSCRAGDLKRTLAVALEGISPDEKKELVIRSDNGSQMRAKEFEEYLAQLPVEHEFIPVKTPNKNAHIESFFSILDNHLERQYFRNFTEAYRWVTEFINFYNGYRIHGRLKMTPDEFEARKDLHQSERYVQAI